VVFAQVKPVPAMPLQFKRKHPSTFRRAKRFKGGIGGPTTSPYYLSRGSRRDASSRRSGQARTVTALFRSLPNTPDVLGIQIRTWANLSWNSTAGAIVTTQFKLSDITNVFGTGSAHTNPTINNFATMYSKAQVMAAKIEIKWAPDSGNGNVSSWFGAFATPGRNATALTAVNVNIVPEASRTMWATLPTLGGHDGKANFRKYFSLANIQGLTPADYATDSQYSCTSNGTSWNSALAAGSETLLNTFMQPIDLTNNCKYFSFITITQWVLLSLKFNT